MANWYSVKKGPVQSSIMHKNIDTWIWRLLRSVESRKQDNQWMLLKRSECKPLVWIQAISPTWKLTKEDFILQSNHPEHLYPQSTLIKPCDWNHKPPLWSCPQHYTNTPDVSQYMIHPLLICSDYFINFTCIVFYWSQRIDHSHGETAF